MNKYMKKKVSVLIISILVLSSLTISFAEVEETKITEAIEFKGEVVELTLEEAINQMLENNSSIQQLELGIEAQEEAYKEYMSPIYDYRKIVKDERKEGTTNYYKFTLLPQLKEEDMVGASKRSLESTTETLKAGIEEAFYKAIQAKENVDIQKESLETKKELFDQTRKKLELGLVAKQALLSAESDYLSAQNDYNSALDGYKTAKMSINVLLGNDIMTNIKLNDELKMIPFKKVDIDNAIKQGLEKRYDLKDTKIDYDIADIEFKILSSRYTPNTFKYKQANAGLEVKKEQYETKKLEVTKEIVSNYMDILTNDEKIKLRKKQVELAKESLRITKLSYELGQVVLTDVQSVESSYKTAKLGLSQAILDYNLAILAFEDSISIGR